MNFQDMMGCCKRNELPVMNYLSGYRHSSYNVRQNSFVSQMKYDCYFMIRN